MRRSVGCFLQDFREEMVNIRIKVVAGTLRKSDGISGVRNWLDAKLKERQDSE